MKVTITPEAKQYIMQNGRMVMILLGSMSGCCGGTAPMPQIHLGSPKDLSGYKQYIMDDITLYIDKRINSEKEIYITLGKLLWLNKLSAELI